METPIFKTAEDYAKKYPIAKDETRKVVTVESAKILCNHTCDRCQELIKAAEDMDCLVLITRHGIGGYDAIAVIATDDLAVGKVQTIINGGLTVKQLEKLLNYAVYSYTSGEYVCNMCGLQFDTLQDALDHLFSEHEDDEIPDTDPTQ
jgi:aromatic ring-opening dioxygenase LigB subunit